ncbi:MAG: hypothetical protein GTN76_16630 [Candidatus Aenigmarchaeota archaeon]|nr:hypothetical protein [Candidatus Aenigmarchaeota archaeon]
MKQAYDIYEERRKHLLHAIELSREGLVVSVFDTTDRIQHMFFRYLDPDHPANRDKESEAYKDAIEELYVKMDGLLGEILSILDDKDVLLVVSDHGFESFKWGINLNSWLWREGYLVFKDGVPPSGEWFPDVDWTRTRAYAYGLSGIFLNLRGRERSGIVDRGEERTKLCGELKSKLTSMLDQRNGMLPIRHVSLAEEALSGPYVDEAPDLFVGYEPGYRASWNSVVGKVTYDIFEENTRSWSGDHSIDPDLMSGVFFSNWKLKDEEPSITDIAPTVLNLFGLEKCVFHDGKVLSLNKPD